MAYFGFKTTGNFIVWMLVALCFVNGAIWFPIGLVGEWMGKCTREAPALLVAVR